MIETARLTLRRPDPEILPGAVAFLCSERARFMGVMTEPEAEADVRGNVLGMRAAKGFGPFALRRYGSDEVIGLAGPWEPEGHPEPEIAWNLWDARHEGQGLATEAARAARAWAWAWAFRTEGWSSAISYTHPENHASHRVAQRLGAVRDDGAPCAYPPPVVVWRHARAEALA
jgi:RimJ/RimL family protein N-acetyltransferase